ncbi:S-layer homology domain-containing protein [candidate division KSB1 bacterium]|nr:S-layer homology domain-containing protein [candidate division KSB1 bacterium]
MQSRTLHLILITVLSVGFLLSGCGPKPIQKESILDTPDNHYNQGLRALERDQLDKATSEFGRATALDPEYPGGYVGMGLVLAEKGDFEKALQSVDKGLGKDDKFIDGYIAKGQIIVKERKGDDWLKKALKEYEKALKIDPESEKAVYFIGMANKVAYQFADAAAAFSKVIAMKGDFAKAANAEWELVQKIQRAAPGSKVGMKIALIPKIDRADLAVLFIEELKLLEVMEKNRKKTYDTGFKAPDDPTAMQTSQTTEMAVATDIDTHWAKSWIGDVIDLGVMDVFPDHTFRPDDKITRSNYAVFLQNILLAVTHDDALATKYIGSPSRFPDVNPTHYAYNAICLSVDRGIMKANTMDGAFGMADPVSGADALLIIRELQNNLRMTF